MRGGRTPTARANRRLADGAFALSVLGLAVFVCVDVAVWKAFGFRRVVRDRAGHGALISRMAWISWAGFALFAGAGAVGLAATLAGRSRARRAGTRPLDRRQGEPGTGRDVLPPSR